jgi:hypothetical protein
MINEKNLIKYAVMFLVVSAATKVIPTCGVLQEHAIYVGLIAASTFALIDICSPAIVIQNNEGNLITEKFDKHGLNINKIN